MVARLGADAFKGNQLTSIDIPGTVTSIERNAFSGNKLTNIVAPDSAKSIGENAFANNPLQTVSIPSNAFFDESAFPVAGVQITRRELNPTPEPTPATVPAPPRDGHHFGCVD